MTMLDVAALEAIREEVFPPWVQDLGWSVTASAPEGRLTIALPPEPRAARMDGALSGQAMAAVADSAGVLALASALGGFRPVATIQMDVKYLKPARAEPLTVTTEILRLGRTTAFVEVRLLNASGAAVAVATLAYAVPQ